MLACRLSDRLYREAFPAENSLLMFSFTHATVRYSVWPHRHVSDVTLVNQQWRSTGRQKRSELHHRGEFLHNYTFESVHDGDHDGVVRIFVGLPASCEV